MQPTIRAVRNNNPGNLNAGDHWRGLLSRSQMTAQQLAEPRFAVFGAPRWGFHAMAVILLNYTRLHNLRTVRQIITRWAPPSDHNPTAAYVKNVCDGMGVEPDKEIDLHDPVVMASLCKAISTQECGGWFFSTTDLMAGISLAETPAGIARPVA